MIEIKDLLKRFDHLLIKETLKKDLIINAINKIVGINIKSKDIKIQNDIVYLNIKPIYKNEILFKKEEIFLKLKEDFGNKSPKNLL